jgi:hypothetical protein
MAKAGRSPSRPRSPDRYKHIYVIKKRSLLLSVEVVWTLVHAWVGQIVTFFAYRPPKAVAALWAP